MSDLQRVQSWEMALNRKEPAALLLSGHTGDPQQLKTLAENVGLRRLPDRVLVLQMKDGAEMSEAYPQVARHIALNRISHPVEDLCQSWPNALSIATRPGELCIFIGRESRNASHQRISLQESAEAIRATVRADGMTGARIGIGRESGHRRSCCAGITRRARRLTARVDPCVSSRRWCQRRCSRRSRWRRW